MPSYIVLVTAGSFFLFIVHVTLFSALIKGYFRATLNGIGECRGCDNGMVCDSKFIEVRELLLREGFFRFDSMSIRTHACRFLNCLGGNNTGDGLCKEGSMGPLCAVCKNKFALMYTSNTCEKCDGAKINDALPHVIIFFVIALATFMLIEKIVYFLTSWFTRCAERLCTTKTESTDDALENTTATSTLEASTLEIAPSLSDSRPQLQRNAINCYDYCKKQMAIYVIKPFSIIISCCVELISDYVIKPLSVAMKQQYAGNSFYILAEAGVRVYQMTAILIAQHDSAGNRNDAQVATSVVDKIAEFIFQDKIARVRTIWACEGYSTLQFLVILGIVYTSSFILVLFILHLKYQKKECAACRNLFSSSRGEKDRKRTGWIEVLYYQRPSRDQILQIQRVYYGEELFQNGAGFIFSAAVFRPMFADVKPGFLYVFICFFVFLFFDCFNTRLRFLK